MAKTIPLSEARQNLPELVTPPLPRDAGGVTGAAPTMRHPAAGMAIGM
jgi:hypothetical protein